MVLIARSCTPLSFNHSAVLRQDHRHFRRPGSSVGIATNYGLDGPETKSRCCEIFRQFRPALEPIQPSVQWVLGLSRRKVRPGRAADPSPPSSAVVMEE